MIDPNPVIRPLPMVDIVTFNVKNYGNTPARRLYICADLLSVARDESPIAKRDALFQRCDSRANPIIGPTIWPTEERSQIIDIGDIISIKNTVDILLSNTRGFLFARIIYDDVFDTVPRPNTFICRVFMPTQTDKKIHILGCNLADEDQDN
jgi:hypothetical protein